MWVGEREGVFMCMTKTENGEGECMFGLDCN